MKEAAILVVSRNVGGLERRFGALFKYCAQNRLPYTLHFVVSRAQRELMPTRYITPRDDNVSLTEFGLPCRFSGGSHRFQLLARMADYLLLAIAVKKKLGKKKLDAVHFVTPSSLLFRGLVPADTKVTSVVNSNYFEQVSSSTVFRKVLRQGFHVDNLSPDLRARVLTMGLSDEARLHAAPCSFVDYEQTGAGKKIPLLTFVSRFVPRKGLDILLPALPEILSRCGMLKILIVGQGPMEEEIRKTVRGISGQERVWVGFAREPVKFLKHSMIFLSLQERENYPSQSLLEAMACGNATIATNVGMTSRLVDDDVGILIRRRSDDLVKAVCCLYQDRKRVMEMGKRARYRVMREHTVERYLSYLEGIYFKDRGRPGGIEDRNSPTC